MNTEEQTNKYTTQFYDAVGTDSPIPTFTAEELLKIMRPEVEKILTLMGIISPPSQSVRAKRALELMIDRQAGHNEVKDQVMCKETWWTQMRELMRAENALKDFLAVNRTVWILEGRPI